MNTYQVGDQIILTKKELEGVKGTILYIGPIEGKEEKYFGIRLEQPLGSHNGTYKDKSYFQCEDKHGIFILDKYIVKPSDYQKTEPKKEEKKSAADPTRAKEKMKTTITPQTQSQPTKKEEPKQAKAPVKDTTKDKKPEPAKATSTTTKKPEVSKQPSEPKAEVQKQVSEPKQEHKVEPKAEPKPEPPKQQGIQEQKQPEPENQFEQSSKHQFEEGSTMSQISNLEIASSHDNEEYVRKINDLINDNNNKVRELDSLKFQYDHVKQELENVKQSQTLLQAVNNDLKGQISTLKRKNEQLEQQAKTQTGGGNEEEIEELNSLVETLTMENEQLKSKAENQKKTLDQQAADIKRLQEEKELAELELEEAILTAGGNLEVDGQGGEANQELVIANGKLRQALQVLSDKLQAEQVQHELEIAQMQQKLAEIPSLHEKSRQLEKLQVSIKKKDEEIEELSQRLDDSSSLSEMVEKLADSMLKKDDEILNLKRNLKEMNELKKVNDELITDLEEVVAQQGGQIKDLEFDVYELKRKIQAQQQESEEKDQTALRLKQKIGQLNKQLELLKDEQPLIVQDSSNQDGSAAGGKVQDLLNKYQEVVQQRREMYKRYLQLQIENSDIRNEVLLKGVLLIRSIPHEYQSKLLFNMVDPLSIIRRVGEKAALLSDELIQTVDTHGDQFIKEENQDLGFWMTEASKHLNVLNNLAQNVSSIIENATKSDQVEKICRNGLLINQFKMAGTQVDEIINLVAEDKLSSKESISGLQVLITHIQDDVNTILQLNPEFNDSVEFEGVQIRSLLLQLIQTLSNAIFNGKLMRDQQIQRKVAKEPFRLDQLVETIHKKAKDHLKIITSYRLSWGTFDAFRGKNGKLYEQLKAVLQEFLQILEQHLSLETQDAFLTGKSNDEAVLKEAFYQSYRDKCISIAHLLNTLNQNLGSYGQNVADLVDEFSISHKNTQSNLHVFNKQSIWGSISSDMFAQLDKITFTIESEKRLKEELDLSLQDKIKMNNEIQNLKKAREALERRIVDLQMKADRVTLLENEKKRLLEKQQSFTEATELTKRELENYEMKYKELEDEKNSLEQMLTMYQSQATKKTDQLEQFIGRQNPRMQSRLQKLIDQNKTELSSQPAQSIQNLDDVKITPVSSNINKVLWKELQKVKEDELRKSILELTANQEHANDKKNNVNEAIVALKKVKHEQLKNMARKKIIRLDKSAQEEPNEVRYDVYKAYSDAISTLNIDQSRLAPHLLQLQPVPLQQNKGTIIIDKNLFIQAMNQIVS